MTVSRQFIRTGSAAVALVAATLIAAVPGPATATPAAAPPASAGEAAAQALRVAMGLDATAGHVRSVAAEPGSHVRLLGVRLSASEDAELRRRNATAVMAAEIDGALANSPAYAGSWLDQRRGGVLTIGITKDSADLRRTVSRMVPAARPVFRTMKTSLSQLTAALTRLQGRSGASRAVQSLELDVESNRIVVTMAPGTSPDIARAVVAGASVATDVVTADGAVVAASGRDQDGGPLYGGQWLSGTSTKCTDGYSNVRDAAGRYYTITAGHCFASGERVYQGLSSGRRSVGNASSVGAGPNFTSNCDCEVVGLIPSGTGTEQVRVYGNQLRRLTRTDTPSVGEYFCQLGATSFEATGGDVECGTIRSLNAVVYYDVRGGTYTLTDSISANIVLRPGDSGGPAIRDTSLLGFNAARSLSGPPIGYLSKASNVGTVNVGLGY